MIDLTRLNGTPIVLNSDLIKTIEESPDSMITLISGEKLIVRETCEEITQRVMAYRASLLSSIAQQLHQREALVGVASISSLDVAEPPTRTTVPHAPKR